jgi:hypothetical protein
MLGNTLDMYRAPLYRMLRSPLLLRSIVYGSFILLALTTLIYVTSPASTIAIVPNYAKPSGPSQKDVSPAEWKKRADQVKQSFLHAYNNYERFAAPHDELRPLTQGMIDKYVFL